MSAALNELWLRMGALYGHRWAAQYGEDAASVQGRTWAAVLDGLTGEEMAAGLRACVSEGGEFPPSAPRFRAMCKGVPSFDRVKREAAMPEPHRSEFVARRVWPYLPLHDYRHASMVQADKLLRSAFDLACEDVMTGKPLPPLNLPPPEPAPVRAAFTAGAHSCGYSQLDTSEEARAARRKWFAENVESPFA